MKKSAAILFLMALIPASPIRALDTDAVIGGAIGGGVGAAVGSEVGGKAGAIIGGALGAAVGTAITVEDDRKSSPSPRIIYIDSEPETVYRSAVPGRSYRRIPPGHAKHWNKHKYKYR